jgi:uncharacterized membrane protein
MGSRTPAARSGLFAHQTISGSHAPDLASVDREVSQGDDAMNGNNPKSTASIAGHPIHPMLIPFPVVFLVTAFVADLVFWSTSHEIWATASLWLLGAGIIVALVAALFGFTDFFADARIRDIGAAWQHMIGNLIAVVLALVNWYIRYRSAPPSACSLGASGFHSSRCCCCYSTDGRDGRWCTGTTSAYRIPGPNLTSPIRPAI